MSAASAYRTADLILGAVLVNLLLIWEEHFDKRWSIPSAPREGAPRGGHDGTQGQAQGAALL